MTLSKQQTPIPDELKKPLPPLKTTETAGQIWEVYHHNMQSCAVCYIRYKALVEAAELREKD